MDAKRYLFAAGGTGGHINPALAVAHYIKRVQPPAEILFVGTPNHMEAQLVPQAGFAFETIAISGLHRGKSPKALVHNLKVLFQVQKSTQQAKRILRDFAPDVVIGFGGYVSGPVLSAAVKLGYPTAVHESNAFPGVANKLLARRVDAVMITSEDAKKHLQPKNPCVVTGMPIRPQLLEANRTLSRFELLLDAQTPLVLSMGGSLGARPINEAVAQMILQLYHKTNCRFLHAAGTSAACEAVVQTLLKNGIDAENDPRVEVRDYIHDMARCLSAADVVICRAGASSISEFQAMGKASILIPSPYLAENHQYYNALSLSEKEAALLLEEKDLTGESLAAAVQTLTDDSAYRQKVEANAKAMALTDANERIFAVLQSLLQ